MKTVAISRKQSVVKNAILIFLMLSIGTALSLMVLPILPAMAGQGNRQPDPDQMMTRMIERLDLTDEQTEQVRPIITEQLEKQKAVFKKYRGMGREGFRAARPEMQAIGQETEDRLKDVLTDEQMEDYRKWQEEVRDSRRRQFRGDFRSKQIIG